MSAGLPCQSDNCLNGKPPSHLGCPTCQKLGIQGSFFCDQACFKANWKTHKAIHAIVTASKAAAEDWNQGGVENTYVPSWGGFTFGGKLRPVYPLSPKRKVPEHIPRPEYAERKDGRPVIEENELGQPPRLLGPEEQEKMRTVCKLTREVLDIAASHIRPGITTDEIDAVVHEECVKRNAYPSPLNYRRFPKSVCTSINEVICHGIPDQRILREGDIINIDVSLYHQGYHGDLNETYPVGKVSEDALRVMRTARKCLFESIKICKPGALFRDIGKVIEPIARENNCSVVRTYTGHGINTSFHPSPNIPHYAKNRAVGAMKPGMCFTIEPMINLGGNWSEVHWPDEWTATTVDGKLSAQFEETLLITETGVEILTAGAPREDLGE